MSKIEEFDNDILKSNQEYLDMINEMQNLYGEGDKSNKLLDQMIERLIEGLNRRITLEQKCEKKYLNRQFKEWKKWQKELKKHFELPTIEEPQPEPAQESLEKPQEENKALPQPKAKHSLLGALKKAFRLIGYRPARTQEQGATEEDISSQAPPTAENPSPKVEDEQDEVKEGEVVEDNEYEVDDESPEDDDVLKF